MIAFEGFFNMMFFPASCFALAGCIVLFLNKKELINKNSAVLLVFIYFVFMFVWRMPVVISKRYTLPMVTPGTVLAVYFLKELWCFKLKNIKIIGLKTLFCIFVISIAIVGVAKSMRFQESKPYLTKVYSIIKNDKKLNGLNTPVVVQMGNVGGEVLLDKKIPKIRISVINEYSDVESHETLYEELELEEPKNLLLRHSAMYLVITSYEPAERFITEWNERYGQKLELCYEYIRERNKVRYQIFKIVSPYKIANLTSEQRLEQLANSSILPNANFTERYEIAEESENIATLRANGFDLPTPIFVPKGYTFNMKSWLEVASPGGLEYTEDGLLQLRSEDKIDLISTENIANNQKYYVGGKITAKKKSIIRIAVEKSSAINSSCSEVEIVKLIVKKGEQEFSGLIDLDDFDGSAKLMFGLEYGDVIWESLYLLPMQ